jgi:hypothetical protein
MTSAVTTIVGWAVAGTGRRPTRVIEAKGVTVTVAVSVAGVVGAGVRVIVGVDVGNPPESAYAGLGEARLNAVKLNPAISRPIRRKF